MKSGRRWAVSGIAVSMVAGLAAIVTSLSAGGAVTNTPAFEPDPNSSYGSITFYNASGTVITGGSDLSHLFDYAVASSPAPRTGITKATAYFAFPDHTQTNSTTWFSAQATAASTFPISSAPAAISSSANPAAAALSSEANLQALLGTTTLDTTAGYANIVQIRLKDSGAGIGKGIQASPFWSSDISFDSVAGTWTQVYPAPAAPPSPTSTTTALTFDHASPITVGTTTTLTATLTPSNAVGTVQFSDGSTNLGSAVTVSAGTASSTAQTFTVGTHTLTAVFTPTDSNAFTTSTSPVSSYVVNAAPATTTTTSLVATPASPAFGATVTMTATVTPSAAGTVQFKDGSTNLGSAVTVTSGQAVGTTSSLTSGAHSLTAVFLPTDPSAFGTSTSSPAQIVTVAAQTTTTALVVTPSGPAGVGDDVTFTATLTPSGAAGTVQIKDNGSTNIGSSTAVSGGTAVVHSTTLTSGTHSFTAVFTPTNSGLLTTSTSSAVGYNVTAGATTTTLTLSKASPVIVGDAETLTATINKTAAAGTVQFSDGSTNLGSPVTVSAGTATYVADALTASASTHQFSAVFSPTDTVTYIGSTSATVTLVVNPPSTATTTTIAVAPTGTVAYGTSVTVTANVSNGGVGTVQFKDGGTNIGSPVTVASGSAAYTTSSLSGPANHSFTAVFTPTDPTAFAGSTTLTPATLHVNAPPATVTTTSIAASPSGQVQFGDQVTITATVSPSGAVGSVQFTDGSTVLGTSPVTNGTASITTTGLALGAHTLNAAFTATDVTVFLNSSSTTAATLTVIAAPVCAAKGPSGSAFTPGDTLAGGSQITLTASGFQPGETVTIVAHSTPVTLGTAVADSSGTVTTTVTIPQSLDAGAHSLVLTGAVGTVSLAFTVAGPAAPSVTADPSPSAGPGLASTGSSLLPVLPFAIGLILFGFGVVLLTRRGSWASGSLRR